MITMESEVMYWHLREEAAGHKDVEINEVDIDNFIRAKGCHFLSYLYDAPVSGF